MASYSHKIIRQVSSVCPRALYPIINNRLLSIEIGFPGQNARIPEFLMHCSVPHVMVYDRLRVYQFYFDKN